MKQYYCRMCDRPCDDETIKAKCLTPKGIERVICDECMMHMLVQLGLMQMPECDHFHEGEGKEVADEVEEFFNKGGK